jgi:hypothetical protein
MAPVIPVRLVIELWNTIGDAEPAASWNARVSPYVPFAVKIAVLGDTGATPFESRVHVASWLAVGAAMADEEVV